MVPGRAGLCQNAAMSYAPSLLPVEDELEQLHTRQYEARTYRLDPNHMLVRGAIRDTKPAGLYVLEDPEPLVIHDMLVELTVELGTFLITDASARFISHPNVDCPSITDHYKKLVGLSVARGFNKKIRELFGGPRGCAHTTALLLAMGPAVHQSLWSMSVASARADGHAAGGFTDAQRDRSYAGNLNTCHIWDENGQHVDLIRKGKATRQPPLAVSQRLEKLGRDPEEWFLR